MKRSWYILVFVVLTILVSSFSLVKYQNEEGEPMLISTSNEFVAGSKISLKFEVKSLKSPMLFIHHSFGSTLLSTFKTTSEIEFIIPSKIAIKTGVIQWKLVESGSVYLEGEITIIPNETKKTIIESYLGPNSIQAGNTDFSMLVVIPTDIFDNPLSDNTSVNISNQFLETINSKEEKTNNFIVWQNIFSKEKSGTILVSSFCNGINSKELITNIYPSNPTDFKLFYDRNHEYADGNQLTEISTSIIKDEFGNTVVDGTLIDFIITTNENNLLKTSASTINGIATAKMLHPEKETAWKVRGMVTGLAESNELMITYKSVLKDLGVLFSEDNRTITIGPLKSFMNQLVPDGITVKLSIFTEDKLVETMTKTSFEGKAMFYLDPEFYLENQYSFKIEALGISKQIDTISYAK